MLHIQHFSNLLNIFTIKQHKYNNQHLSIIFTTTIKKSLCTFCTWGLILLFLFNQTISETSVKSASITS